MKRFLKYVAIFILPFCIVAIGLEIMLRKIPNDYLYKRDYLSANAKHIRVLILGNSHTYYGIDPLYFHSAGFNAAMISQYLNHDLEILKKFESTWDSLQYIVVPVDYFSLYGRLEKSIESWRAKNYAIYYGIHSTISLAGNTEIFSNKVRHNVERLYKYYFKNISNVNCSPTGWGTYYKGVQQQDLELTGQKAAERHRAKNDEYFKKNVDVLQSIVDFAKARNVRILLITCPAYKTYSERLDKGQLNQTVETATKVAATYEGARYYNLLSDDSFDNTDFYDADHLNEFGAKKLSQKIDSLIQGNNH